MSLSGTDIHTSDYYFLFEEKFRGSRELVKARLRRYIPYFKGCRRVLDIGCGRGEFLELCKEEGIESIGVDINEDMIKFCEGKFNVVKSDAIEYLKSLPDKYLDGVMISHFVEHLDPERLFELLSLCYSKMKYSSYIVIESPNPTSLYSLINFYIDPTHKKPVHPETLKFILEYLGFRDVKIEFFEECEELTKLAKIDSNTVSEEVIRVINENIEKLNRILFGPQDYAIIAKKEGHHHHHH
uniref:methyltransferase n=1 Tax=Archaeoglobus fulgidus TaxID=2234 RepID=UPI0001798FBD|nr:Chain A, methyltransferase [Archaeoglobus fulgidus]3DLI_B Chain B, methyltransferase [Archaeoglobus fulgidus]3DLI_C Chain C, methyltransferase [Archaeoglobus fulgidus]